MALLHERLGRVSLGRPNTGNQHKTFPVAKREKRENQFPIPLGLGFAKLANHSALCGLAGRAPNGSFLKCPEPLPALLNPMSREQFARRSRLELRRSSCGYRVRQ